MTFAGLCASALSAQAQDACLRSDYFNDDKDVYALGKILMGQDVTDRPGIAEAQARCIEAGKVSSSAGDCQYQGDDGVIYFIENRGDRLLSTGAKVSISSHFRGHLIANIKLGDSLSVVRRKLKALPSGFPKWTLSQRDGAAPRLTSDETICSSNGEVWSYRLLFDLSAHLVSVSSGQELGMYDLPPSEWQIR